MRIALLVRFAGATPVPEDLAAVTAACSPEAAPWRTASQGPALLARQVGPETEEPRPRTLDGGRRWLFDGRLDNRRELAAELGVGAAAADEEVLDLAWQRWGTESFRRLRGPFVAVLWEPWQRRLTCARDPLGERTLAYHHDGDRGILVAASDEEALLAHPAIAAAELDDDTLARFLAVEAPRPGATFHAAVRELPAGRVLTVDERGARLAEYGVSLAGADEAPGRSGSARHGDDEWTRLFRAALEDAVAASLSAAAGDGGVGVMLSGGLDSSSLAVLAAAQRRATGAAPPLAVSWVFDDPALAACDERRWIEAVARCADLPVHTVAADDAWPLAAGHTLARSGAPSANPYRLLKQRLYAAARDQGVKVLLSGAGGDLLWTGGRRGWLADLLAEGRLATAGAEVAAALVARRFGHLRAAAAGLLPPRRRRAERPWLRADTAQRVAAGDPAPIASTADWRRRNLTGAVAARGFAGEATWARRAGIELRDPFRDRRVVDLALQAPAHLLHRRGEDKALLRRALADLLPEAVLRRRGSAHLGPLFRRGVAERERSRVETLLIGGELWRRHVDETWMRRALDQLTRGTLRGAAAVALWRAVAVEHWLAARDTGQAAPPRPADALLGAGGGR